jgi:glycosyltransferase involved in cell wall biosynthesis
MQYPISLTIFFPTFNEEENIEQLLTSTVRVVDASPFIHDYEILVINDGSTDATRARAEAFVKQHPQVRVITHANNKGMVRHSRLVYVKPARNIFSSLMPTSSLTLSSCKT